MVEQPIWPSCQLAILGRQWVFIQTECSDCFSNYGGNLFFYCMGNFQSRKKPRSFQGTTFTFFFLLLNISEIPGFDGFDTGFDDEAK